jgi:HSP20 family protein
MIERFLPRPAGQDAPSKTRPRDVFDLMDSFWRGYEGFPLSQMSFPSLDVSETEKEVIVKAEMPGMDSKDIDLYVEGDNLIVRGEKKQENEDKDENYHRVERSYGAFHRSIPLPSKCDQSKVKAKYKNGVLTVKLPKSEDAVPKRVQIES